MASGVRTRRAGARTARRAYAHCGEPLPDGCAATERGEDRRLDGGRRHAICTGRCAWLRCGGCTKSKLNDCSKSISPWQPPCTWPTPSPQWRVQRDKSQNLRFRAFAHPRKIAETAPALMRALIACQLSSIAHILGAWCRGTLDTLYCNRRPATREVEELRLEVTGID